LLILSLSNRTFQTDRILKKLVNILSVLTFI